MMNEEQKFLNQEEIDNTLEDKKSIIDSLKPETINNIETSIDILNALYDEDATDNRQLFEYIYKVRQAKKQEDALNAKHGLEAQDLDRPEELIDFKYNILEDNELYRYLLDAINTGSNKLQQKRIVQTMKIDEDWIEIIEQGLSSIANIVKQPKIFIKEDRELVNVEKAKRIDNIAVRHLSTHTELIKEVRNDDSIVPSKVMTRVLNEDQGIYENRFVYALILRLSRFVDKRYTIIKNDSKQKEQTILQSQSSFKLGKGRVKYNLGLEINMPSHDKDVIDTNNELLDRLDEIKTRIDILRGSKFYQEMSKLKIVKPPIMRTNIISNNVDYKNCYAVWTMLSRYTSEGYFIDLKEKDLPIDKSFFGSISKVIANTVETAVANNYLRDKVYDAMKYSLQKQSKHRFTKTVDYQVEKMPPPKDWLDENGFLSEYYYKKIMASVDEIAEKSKASIYTEVEDVKVNFRQFYKGLQLINNELYYSLLNMAYQPMTLTDAKNVTDKDRKTDLKRLKHCISKQNLLCEMKKDELRLATLRLESLKKRLARREEQEARLLAFKKAQESKRKQKEREKAKARARAVAKSKAQNQMPKAQPKLKGNNE